MGNFIGAETNNGNLVISDGKKKFNVIFISGLSSWVGFPWSLFPLPIPASMDWGKEKSECILKLCWLVPDDASLPLLWSVLCCLPL